MVLGVVFDMENQKKTIYDRWKVKKPLKTWSKFLTPNFGHFFLLVPAPVNCFFWFFISKTTPKTIPYCPVCRRSNHVQHANSKLAHNVQILYPPMLLPAFYGIRCIQNLLKNNDFRPRITSLLIMRHTLCLPTMPINPWPNLLRKLMKLLISRFVLIWLKSCKWNSFFREKHGQFSCSKFWLKDGNENVF